MNRVLYQKEYEPVNEPELKRLKVLYGIYAFLIITLLVMPQYFGVHLGFDFTCSRIADLALVIYMICNQRVFTHFFRTVIRCEVAWPLFAYLFVAAYTMIFRTSVNAFFLVFLEILTFFFVVYGIRYVIGVEKVIKWILCCAYFLSIYGLVEFLYGRSIFLQFLATMPTAVKNSYRSGHYRIMGPCGHSLAYGLLLLLFVAIACYDYKKDELYLFRRPMLLVLLVINIFLTGSRSTLGLVMVELVFIFIFTKTISKKKSLFFTGVMIFSGLVFIVVSQGTSIGNYLMGQITSVVDQAFGTSYAIKYGIDTTTLENSSAYREMLPLIFTLDWLNPIVGRGNGFSGAEINGVYIHSIDHFYVSQYIQYAYPGMISYVFFIVVAIIVMIYDYIKNKSGLVAAVLIGFIMYFWNLIWVDALQTLKFAYLFLAIYYAYRLKKKERLNLRLYE